MENSIGNEIFSDIFKKFVIVQKIFYIRSQIEGFCFIFKKVY